MNKAGKPRRSNTMGDVVDDPLDALGERDVFPMHDECFATLTMKCGSPDLAVRKKLHEEILIPFVPDEGFAVFQTKIERHFVKISPTYVQPKRAIYLKPSSNATQSKYLLLAKENFESALRMRWKVAKSMKTELKYEVFCYFIDTAKNDKRRKLVRQQPNQSDPSSVLVDGHVNAAMDASAAFLAFNPLPQAMQGYAEVAASLVESSTTRKSAVSSARPPSTEGNILERPRKVARVNRPATGTGETIEETQFVPIPFRINGIEVPIEVDIAALRRYLLATPPRNQSGVASTVPSAALHTNQHRR